MFYSYAIAIRDLELEVRSYHDTLMLFLQTILNISNKDVRFAHEFDPAELDALHSDVKQVVREAQESIASKSKTVEQLFQAIVEKQFLVTSKYRVQHLEKTLFQLY